MVYSHNNHAVQRLRLFHSMDIIAPVHTSKQPYCNLLVQKNGFLYHNIVHLLADHRENFEKSSITFVHYYLASYNSIPSSHRHQYYFQPNHHHSQERYQRFELLLHTVRDNKALVHNKIALFDLMFTPYAASTQKYADCDWCLSVLFFYEIWRYPDKEYAHATGYSHVSYLPMDHDIFV